MVQRAKQSPSTLRGIAAWPESKRELHSPTLPTPAFPPLPRGLPRGCLVEIVGSRSSGRTATVVYWLACATQAGETCAVIDLHNQFPPDSAEQAGVNLHRLVWVRGDGKVEQAVRSADLLLHASGFGIVVLDLCEADPRTLQRIPNSCWYRFRRAVETTPTTFVVCAESAQAQSCAALHLYFRGERADWAGTSQFSLLQAIQAQVIVREKAAPQIYTIPVREVV